MTREEIIRRLAVMSELAPEVVEKDFSSLPTEMLEKMVKLVRRVEAIGEYSGCCMGNYLYPIPDYLE